MVFKYFAYDYAEAEKTFEPAMPLFSTSEWFDPLFLQLIEVFIAQGAVERIEETLRRFRGRRSSEWYIGALILSALLKEMESEAQSFLEELRLVETKNSYSDAIEFTYLADRGNLGDTQHELQRKIEQEVDEVTFQYRIALVLLKAVKEVPRTTEEGNQVSDLLVDITGEIATYGAGPNFFSAPDLVVLGKSLLRRGALEEADELTRAIKPAIESSSLSLWKSYGQILEGEILAGQGQYSEALELFEAAVALQQSFQVHESLAYIHEQMGNLSAAIAENEWLIAQRGRALVEGDGVALRIKNVIDWNYAILRLARLHERLAQKQKAITYYQRFVDRWRHSDQTKTWNEARIRLVELLAERSGVD